MTEKLYKNINGIRVELSEEEKREYLLSNEKKLLFDKEEYKKVIKNNCQNKILSKYSLIEQTNIRGLILGYTEKDLKEMNSFIEREVQICRDYIKKLEKLISQKGIEKLIKEIEEYYKEL